MARVIKIDNALQKQHEYTDERYATYNPCTTVYRLVRQLTGTDEEFNAVYVYIIYTSISIQI